MPCRIHALEPGGCVGLRISLVTAFASFVTGRYTRWFVIFSWVVVAAMAGSLQPKLQEATSNETISYLPRKSDAATVAKLQKSAFKSGAETPAGGRIYRT